MVTQQCLPQKFHIVVKELDGNDGVNYVCHWIIDIFRQC